MSKGGPTIMPRERVADKLVGQITRFPRALIDDYSATLNVHSSKLVYERSYVKGSQVVVEDPSCLAGKHVLVLTGTEDTDHTRSIDGLIVDWIRDNGGAANYIWLSDHNIAGNGHMLMMEELRRNRSSHSGLVESFNSQLDGHAKKQSRWRELQEGPKSQRPVIRYEFTKQSSK